jgi:hypothetical protein
MQRSWSRLLSCTELARGSNAANKAKAKRRARKQSLLSLVAECQGVSTAASKVLKFCWLLQPLLQATKKNAAWAMRVLRYLRTRAIMLRRLARLARGLLHLNHEQLIGLSVSGRCERYATLCRNYVGTLSVLSSSRVLRAADHDWATFLARFDIANLTQNREASAEAWRRHQTSILSTTPKSAEEYKEALLPPTLAGVRKTSKMSRQLTQEQKTPSSLLELPKEQMSVDEHERLSSPTTLAEEEKAAPISSRPSAMNWLSFVRAQEADHPVLTGWLLESSFPAADHRKELPACFRDAWLAVGVAFVSALHNKTPLRTDNANRGREILTRAMMAAEDALRRRRVDRKQAISLQERLKQRTRQLERSETKQVEPGRAEAEEEEPHPAVSTMELLVQAGSAFQVADDEDEKRRRWRILQEDRAAAIAAFDD